MLQLVVMPAGWIMRTLEGTSTAPRVLVVALAAIVVTYFSSALRRAYGTGFVRATLSGFALALALVAANVSVYRAVQFAIVFALT